MSQQNEPELLDFWYSQKQRDLYNEQGRSSAFARINGMTMEYTCCSSIADPPKAPALWDDLSYLGRGVYSSGSLQ